MYEAVPRFLNFQETNAVFGCNLQVGEGKRKKKKNGKRNDRKCFSHASQYQRGKEKRKEHNILNLFFFVWVANKRELKRKMFFFLKMLTDTLKTLINNLFKKSYGKRKK